MGTNYYYHTEKCDHCSRANILHVGKKSMGWTFQFRAHRGQVNGNPDVICVADWARVFKTIPGILIDENERIVKDHLKFLEELERPVKAQQEAEDSPERRGHWPIDPTREWRDAEGFAFYDGEFS